MAQWHVGTIMYHPTLIGYHQQTLLFMFVFKITVDDNCSCCFHFKGTRQHYEETGFYKVFKKNEKVSSDCFVCLKKVF